MSHMTYKTAIRNSNLYITWSLKNMQYGAKYATSTFCVYDQDGYDEVSFLQWNYGNLLTQVPNTLLRKKVCV
jgi:hypothetical protein